MGLRDKFKRGGGFLNGVDGVIVEAIFTDFPDFGTGGKAKKNEQLFYAITARVDGAAKDEVTHLFAGNSADFEISEDGHVLTPVGDAQLWGGTAFDNFYGSMIEGGLEDVDANEDGSMDFSHVPGNRVRFIQVKDEDAMARSAKNFKANKGNAKKLFNEMGQKKGKDGKYYDIRTLQVSEVYGQVEVEAAPAGKSKSAARTNGSGVKATNGSGKRVVTAPPEPEVDESDIRDKASDTLVAILQAAKGNTIKKNDLNRAVTVKLAKDPDRDIVRKFLYDDENLGAFVEESLIEYDVAKQMIALA